MSVSRTARRRFFVLNMALVLEFWRRERRRFIALLLLTLVSVAVTIAFPRIMGLIVDGIESGLKNAPSFGLRKLVSFALVLLALGVSRSVVSNFWFYNAFVSGTRFSRQTRSRVFEQLLGKGMSFTNRYPTGDVLVRLDDDLEQLSFFAGFSLLRTFDSVLSLLFTLGILVSMNWRLTIITVLPLSLTVVVWLRLGPALFKRYRDWREKISATSNALEASYSGIRLVKSCAMEERSRKSFRRVLNERIAAALKATRADALVDALFGSVTEIGILLVLTAGGTAVIGAHLTLGSFVAFNAYVLGLIIPMFFIGNLFVRGKMAQAAEERLRALRDFPPDVDITLGSRQPPAQGEVVLHRVGFEYPPALTESEERDLKSEKGPGDQGGKGPGQTPGTPEPRDPRTKTRALRNISLAIKPGTRVGIAGTVGSGKSTIMRLLLRIAEPTEGEITLAGVPLREYDIKFLREMFGYAPQESSLISDSIQNNITLGRTATADGQPAATDEHVREVTRIAQLEAELKNMPNGLNETIGERGLKLSGGQQGRVSIARALFSRPRLLLLDDVTASLDAETEQEFIRDVTAYMKDASLLIVSHRLSILAACDIVYVMDQGGIVESGTHAELLEKRGTYWKLYERQLMKEALEKG
jgi:ABC-type multidrug transport system fused ATPase/permease subunit